MCEDRIKDLVSSGERLRRSSSNGELVMSPKVEKERAQYKDAFEALSRKTTSIKPRERAISPIPDTPPSSQEGWTDDEEDEEEEEEESSKE